MALTLLDRNRLESSAAYCIDRVWWADSTRRKVSAIAGFIFSLRKTGAPPRLGISGHEVHVQCVP